MRILLLLCTLLLAAPVAAKERGTTRALVCDTEAQVRRVVELGYTYAAVAQVNAEVRNDTACTVTNFYAADHRPLADARAGVRSFKIFEVLVIGLPTPSGFQLLPRPVVWYAALFAGHDI